jgi:hypothetical protein
MMFPNNGNFIEKWNSTEERLLDVMKKELKPKDQLQKLSDCTDEALQMTKNQRVATIISALHHILYAPHVIYGKKNWRATIIDTIECMLLIIGNESTADIEIKAFEKKLKEKKLPTQAYIIGFGSSYDKVGDKFCVRVEDIQYIFDGELALLDCLEMMLKFYHVVNLSYPILNKNVFSFLSAHLLNVPCNDASSKVAQLIHALKL